MFGAELYPTLYEKAAALLHSVARNHALVDGNQRTAWLAMRVFLRLNGYLFDEEPVAAYDFMIGLFERSEFRFEKLEPWLREKARAL